MEVWPALKAPPVNSAGSGWLVAGRVPSVASGGGAPRQAAVPGAGEGLDRQAVLGACSS